MISTYINIPDKDHNTRSVRVNLLHAHLEAIYKLARQANTGFSQALIVFLSAQLKISTATHGTNDHNNSANR